MPRFLVTGGAGFIGSSLATQLSDDADNQVVVIDNLLTGRTEHVDKRPNLKFIKADVNKFNELAAVFKQVTFDYVYHYAAVVGVQRTLQHPLDVLRDIDGIRNVLQLCKDNGVKRIFYASSSEVYGEPVEMPQHEETTPLNSRLPYAIVKNVGESFMRSYQYEYGLDYTVFRFFNTYGPRQSTDFVMSKFLKAALRGEDITIYGDGSQTRTFCYIDDNVTATINAVADGGAINQVFNIGNDQEISIKDLAEKIIKLTGSKSKLVSLPPLKEGDMTRRQPDTAKMMKLLDRPLTPLDDGIRKVIAARS